MARTNAKRGSKTLHCLGASIAAALLYVSLDEDANTLVQAQRAAAAAHCVQIDTESRYRLGATPFFATCRECAIMYAKVQ